MWLGGLFTPEAYLTAIRQCTAQSLHVSLEELVMHVQMLDQSSQANANKENTFYITGLKLQGASCRNNALYYSSSITDDIPLLAVEWKMPSGITSEKKNDQQEVTLPVYGNGLRTELLCTINVKAGQANTSEFHFYERGVAVLASSLE
jgi:dynein heavy chain 1